MPAECNIGEAAGHSITGNLPRSNWMPSDFFFFLVCVYVAFFFPFFFFSQANRAPAVLGPGSWRTVFLKGTFLQEYPHGLLGHAAVASGRRSRVLMDEAESCLLLPRRTRQKMQCRVPALPGEWVAPGKERGRGTGQQCRCLQKYLPANKNIFSTSNKYQALEKKLLFVFLGGNRIFFQG